MQKEVWREEAIDDVWRETTRRGTNADTNIVVGDDSATVENTIKKRYRPTFFIPCGASAVEVALAAASTEGHKASMRRRSEVEFQKELDEEEQQQPPPHFLPSSSMFEKLA